MHNINICQECGKVISQCRCPSPDKVKTFSVCEDCKKLKSKIASDISEGMTHDL